MKVKILAVLLFVSYSLAAAVAAPKEGETIARSQSHRENKGKRATASYATTPRAYVTASPDVAYATAKVTPQTFEDNPSQQQQKYQIRYVQQPQQALQQQQYQYEYEPQQTTKLSPAKISYASAQQHVPFSLASDVSSFSYSSPLVSYSNLGLLKQSVGKIAESQVSAYNPQQQQQYTSEARVQTYSSQQQQPQQVTYIPQKATYSSHQPQKYKTQLVAAALPQTKYAYVSSPKEFAYAPVSPKVVYATEAPTQYASVKGQQQQVVYAQAPKAQPHQYQESLADDEVTYQYQPQQQQVAYTAGPQQVYQQSPVYQSQQQQAQQHQQQYIYVQAQPQNTVQYEQQQGGHQAAAATNHYPVQYYQPHQGSKYSQQQLSAAYLQHQQKQHQE